jgi:diacylglycerol kinase (ATP)
VQIDRRSTIGGVPSPSAPLLILNPAAGEGRARRLQPWLSRRLRFAGPGARLIETRGPGHARELALHAADAGHDRVVAVGGDGTVQEVVNGLLEANAGISLGVLAGGNGNDLARSLGLPHRAEEALAIALGGATRSIDVLSATRGSGSAASVRYFAAAGGIGFDAQVAAAMAGPRRRWQHGRLGYALSTLMQLGRFHNRRVDLTISTPDGERRLERRVLFVAFANGMYYGGGMQICPDASLVDGWFDLCVVGDISRLEAARQLPGLYRGRHVSHPAVEFVRASSAQLEGEAGTLAHLDGEPFGALPLAMAVRHLALSVAAPPPAPLEPIG